MNWMSLDTDISEDRQIQKLIKTEGMEAYGLWNMTLTLVAKEVDIDNENIGLLNPPTNKTHAKYLSFLYEMDISKVKAILDKCAELDLICPEKWEEGEVYYHKLGDRKQVKNYLNKQKGGRSGGKKSKPPRSPSRNPSGSPSRSPSRSPRTDIDKDIDKDKEKQSNGSDSDESEPTYPEKYEGTETLKRSKEAVKWLASKITEQNERREVPDENTKVYRDWVLAFCRMVEVDGYTFGELNEILQFAFDDEFWSKQVKSATGLRKKGSNGQKKIVNIEDAYNSTNQKTKAQKEFEEAV